MSHTALEHQAALVALLRARPRGMSWSEIAGEVAHMGDPVALWTALNTDSALLPDPVLDEALRRARAEVTQWAELGLNMVTVVDDLYPERLLEIRETPPFLFARGELRRSDPGMSVVGSRRATERGHAIARTAAELLIDRGLTVIAGLAAGIDTTAHQTALAAGGRTVAFIGTGIRNYYPAANRALQDQIADHGLVLSQFLPDAPPTQQSFPMRNAAMSGYGLATIVVEAGETSGTRIQARLAVEHGRPVILTDTVARTTEWGAALQDRPGVFVAGGASELAAAVDEVLGREQALGDAVGDAMRELAGSSA